MLGNGLEDVGFITLRYPRSKLGHIHVSWADPHKVRECVVVGSDRRIAFNDLDPVERVRVFDRGVKLDIGDGATSFGEHLQIREGDITSPALAATEPLKHLCGHFLHCIRRDERPLTPGRDGRDVVAVMQAIEASLAQDGAPVRVDAGSPARARGSLAGASAFVDLWAQQAQLASELKPVLAECLERTDWVLGSELESFEHEFADYCGVDHAVGTDSGLSALELVMRASGIGPGDEVITAANTFIATVLAISHAGASPVLVDIDPHTDNLDPAQARARDHAANQGRHPCSSVRSSRDGRDKDRADVHGLLVIEDACQAHGARYHGRPAGSLGDAAAFSFYPAKNLGAFGDGGAVVTDNPELAESVRTLRDYGQRRKYHHVAKGFNRRLDTLQGGTRAAAPPRWLE